MMAMMLSDFWHLLLLLVVLPIVVSEAVEYGVDVSYPMHHPNVTTPTNNPLGDRQSFYEENIQGCEDFYQSGKCLTNERVRVKMSLRQPKSMVNYTELGYTKIKSPESVMKLLLEFWQANKEKARNEKWAPGNTYTNHWKVPSKLVKIEDQSMDGGGEVLKQKVWDAARDTIEEWTGQRLAECSLYGIRIYEEGAVLATHVDRLPLVSSAIINVDQDVDEPWPLEVIGHDGKAVSMWNTVHASPSIAIAAEHHSRPFPLKGRFMSNIFVHFEPVGPISDPSTNRRLFRGDLPPYLIPGSEEEDNWRRANPNGWKATRRNSYDYGSTEAHVLANRGNALSLNKALDNNRELVHARDDNGWTALHEAVRSGCFDCVVNLIQRGADVNALTVDGRSPLHHAKKYDSSRSHNNRISHFLQRYGAREMGPEL
ncbi:Ankyrin Repeat [Seminavis robusta]|uniref:Ankyrin Repeat n=1 Tax=Seminavis robusta TaxID=568900 RepID=A0A9N8D775_9STRA|nr:Ankyrin Repeat [Seminavis robusta]|eukprot:Sro5_g004740.1 Ankyrin Repeat (427) ;mRNA; f:241806-244041